MMLNPTPEEEELEKKLDDKDLSEEEREKIKERLVEIYREQTYPFVY
ncbi:MAG: hypothetical protein K2F73_06635 [Ruminococcus sp.]|nr:hypothetical protein [Ruminococcus sp.]